MATGVSAFGERTGGAVCGDGVEEEAEGGGGVPVAQAARKTRRKTARRMELL
jgi:hypothetical protein